MKDLKQTLEKYRGRLFSLKNVVGVGSGYKQVDGEETDEECIVVFVEEKVEKQKLSRGQVVPQQLEEQETDVIEVGEVELLAKKEGVRTKRLRPAQPGVSIGHHKITAGTFGAVVKDRKKGQPLILSNNHVLANISNGRDGRAQKGDDILQPGSYDGGEVEDAIGHLERFIPIYESKRSECPFLKGFRRLLNGLGALFNPDYKLKPKAKENKVDGAVAAPKNLNLIKSEILDVGMPTGVAEPSLGMKVKKSGRTTGLTTSKIKAIDVSINVRLSASAEALFEEQILMEPFSKPGDSGSLVVNEQEEAVGLLFAGSEKSTFANTIQNVMDALQIEL